MLFCHRNGDPNWDRAQEATVQLCSRRSHIVPLASHIQCLLPSAGGTHENPGYSLAQCAYLHTGPAHWTSRVMACPHTHGPAGLQTHFSLKQMIREWNEEILSSMCYQDWTQDYRYRRQQYSWPVLNQQYTSTFTIQQSKFPLFCIISMISNNWFWLCKVMFFW